MSNTIAYARRNDPVTSWAAAESVTEETKARAHRAVLNWLAENRNGTQGEAVSALCGRYELSPERIRTSFTELEREGKVARTEWKRASPGHRLATVWILNQETTQEALF